MRGQITKTFYGISEMFGNRMKTNEKQTYLFREKLLYNKIFP